MKVKTIRYFETSHGLGYEAKTAEGTIWNNGNGGATYFKPFSAEARDAFAHLTEHDLERLIYAFEEAN